MRTADELIFQLKQMGLKHSDTIMLHSSMKKIGPIEGGADTVLNVLCDYFSDGLILLPTLTWSVAYAQSPVFDVKNTPCQTGILPEIFRQRPGVVRSLHPTHSVAAYGKDAREVIKNNIHSDTPCGFSSPWYQLYRRNAVILQAGCTLTSCTYIHGVEEWCAVPNRLDRWVDFTMVQEDGSRFSMSSRPHKGSPSEQFYLAEKILRRSGALYDGQFGNAHVLCVRAQNCLEALSPVLFENPQLFDESK